MCDCVSSCNGIGVPGSARQVKTYYSTELTQERPVQIASCAYMTSVERSVLAEWESEFEIRKAAMPRPRLISGKVPQFVFSRSCKFVDVASNSKAM